MQIQQRLTAVALAAVLVIAGGGGKHRQRANADDFFGLGDAGYAGGGGILDPNPGGGRYRGAIMGPLHKRLVRGPHRRQRPQHDCPSKRGRIHGGHHGVTSDNDAADDRGRYFIYASILRGWY